MAETEGEKRRGEGEGEGKEEEGESRGGKKPRQAVAGEPEDDAKAQGREEGDGSERKDEVEEGTYVGSGRRGMHWLTGRGVRGRR